MTRIVRELRLLLLQELLMLAIRVCPQGPHRDALAVAVHGYADFAVKDAA